MEIELLRVRDAAVPCVDFQCAYGVGWGRWMSDDMPKPGDVTHVEIDLPEQVLDWHEVVPAEHLGHALRPEAELLVITGTVEKVAEDGVIAYRVGSDVVLLDNDELLAAAYEGATFEVKVSYLELYPLNL